MKCLNCESEDFRLHSLRKIKMNMNESKDISANNAEKHNLSIK